MLHFINYLKSEVSCMKRKLKKPDKRTKDLNKPFLFNAPKPTNENCDCCNTNGICQNN